MQAVIMAGGKGTRLANITKNELPKPMVTLCGKPILEHQIDNLKAFGIIDIIIIVGYLGQTIKDYFGNGSKFGVNISYIEEKTPLGTAGALYYLKDRNIGDNFILLFGDLMIDIDWEIFIQYHINNNALITLFSHPNSHPFDSDILIVNNGVVSGIDSKHNVRDYDYNNITNAGIYILNKKVLDNIQLPEKIDFEHNIIMPCLSTKKVFAYLSSEYVKDVGTEERFYSVSKDIKSGIVAAKNLSRKQKCIFLDRDGTINVNEGYITHKEQIHLYKDTAEAIRKINHSEYICVVITNQPVIARGEATYDVLDDIHKRLETILGKEGAYYDALYFCPHHPDKGFAGEVKELKIDCDCRKPKIGLLLKAQEKYNIDFEKSWFVGDADRDVLTGKNAGTRTILVDNNSTYGKNCFDVKPDFNAKTLLDAINLIIK
jgi:D,D-heptose 1,7-bisphosphate phosphatase